MQGIDFDHYYSPVAHPDSFRINISIVDMHRLTVRILDVSNASNNTSVHIHERVCVVQPPYYIDCFERSYANVPVNRGDGQFYIQCTNGIQGTKPVELQWNRHLDSVVTIIKYKRRTIDNTIYIKVLYDGTFSYIMISTDDVLNTTNNEIEFPELTRVF